MKARYRFYFLIQAVTTALIIIFSLLFGAVFYSNFSLVKIVWGALLVFDLVFVWGYISLLWYCSKYDYDEKNVTIYRGFFLRKQQRIDVKAIQYVTRVRFPFTKNAALTAIHTIGGIVIIFR